MNLRIDNGQALSEAGRIDRLDRTIENPGASADKAGQFGSELGKAIGEIDKLQGVADTQVDAVARGAGNIHEMALALEKADVSMRLAMRVRNKLVDTYNEIMRMGI
ncbi:MAG TPA: flagellar hook-basal body complex protein FliE [Polyangia bacterium]|jgi:flagellar hook-basal body complex protein FliE